MPANGAIRRYAAYFHGWAQAFGEHQRVEDPVNALRWLLGEQQIGIILEPGVRRRLFAEVLARHGQEPPPVTLDEAAIAVGGIRIDFSERSVELPRSRLLQLLTGTGPLHLFQTYHLIYPSGTRILTLSERPPLSILYREMPPLALHITGRAQEQMLSSTETVAVPGF